jgi:predicted secreted hydrolase
VTWRPADTRGATFELLERWTSPESRAIYPVAWRVRLPAELLDVVVRTPLAAQEVRSGGVMFDYWEGLVSYRGTWGDDEIRGEGYLEMTGYAAPLALR